ncbi:PREDICTED: uncharacterized protein LOC103327776 [Prunus mume]|uniref:Uncharacterized protein LOC103327776 n=1 Tax=Prunus mume TaxID=102107 RepID=A0ABM0NQM7_PRUMU|nr:PREDICTED: uncharacterized protein LOC103327776 [Prunus mume]
MLCLIRSLSFPVISTLLFTKRRKAMQLFPERVIKIWSLWELRVAVLISLGFQSILILIGNWRKHSTNDYLRIVLWLAYLLAESTATFSLGVLSNSQEDSQGDSANPDYIITAFWAPFLLLHLGGPDIIAAYSSEDNELWLRHLLRLGSQLLVASNILFRAWSSEALNFLALPMFIVGIIKSGERTWVLRSASSEQFRDSMLQPPDPGPNYDRYMEDYSSRRDEGFRVELGTFSASKAATGSDQSREPAADDDSSQNDPINKAYTFFESLKKLCADLILNFHDVDNSQNFFQATTCEEAFDVIEIELSFIYDVFYTKAVLVYSGLGGILRCFTFSLTVLVFLIFLFIEKQAYREMDVIITFIMLAGAIILEIYALIILLSSDWTKLWLNKNKHTNTVACVVGFLHKTVSYLPLVNNKSWSNSLGQYELIKFCLKTKPAKCILFKKDCYINTFLEKHRYKDYSDESLDFVKKLIFGQLQEKSKTAKSFKDRKELCAGRGDKVLDKKGLKILGWTINDAEFDQSILLWHIATDLCYYSDLNEEMNPATNLNCRASMRLSNYMLYLLVICPFMLPNGIGEIRYRDTCSEAEDFFTERKLKSDGKEARIELMEVCTDLHPAKVKGDRSKSVLFDACRLAKDLQAKENWDNKKKWELISHVWVEMLSYAANQCRWRDHTQQLRRGGELLTHVWLLMAHLGLTEQYQISVGHKRPKLIVQ